MLCVQQMACVGITRWHKVPMGKQKVVHHANVSSVHIWHSNDTRENISQRHFKFVSAEFYCKIRITDEPHWPKHLMVRI